MINFETSLLNSRSAMVKWNNNLDRTFPRTTAMAAGGFSEKALLFPWSKSL